MKTKIHDGDASSPPSEQATPEQVALVEHIASHWRGSGRWPTELQVILHLHKSGKKWDPFGPDHPSEYLTQEHDAGKQLVGLRVAGVAVTARREEELVPLFALMRAAVEKYLRAPLDPASYTVRNADLEKLLPHDSGLRERVQFLFWQHWQDGSTQGATWERRTGLHHVALRDVKDWEDFAARIARQRESQSPDTDEHRALARQAYDRWHSDNEWPRFRELVWANPDRPVYTLLREIPDRLLRTTCRLSAEDDDRYRLRIEGVRWVMPNAPELSLCFRVVGAIVQRLAEQGEEFQPCATLAAHLQVPVEDVRRAGDLITSAEIGAYLSEATDTFQVTSLILSWSHVSTVESYLAAKAERAAPFGYGVDAGVEKGQTISSLAARYEQLKGSDENPQQRGLDLEVLLADLLRVEGLSAEGSFRSSGEQTDLAFVLDHHHFLVEAKWQSDPAGFPDVSKLRAKVKRKAESTFGVFVSISGYVKNINPEMAESERPSCVGFDAGHLEAVLRGDVTFGDLVREARARISTKSGFYMPYSATPS